MNYTLPAPLYKLPELSAILVAGADASTFLQGQVSFDMTRLTPQRIEFTSCNSAQGRVQSLAWLLARTDGIVMLVASELLESTIARLRKYTLRAKISIGPATDRLIVCGSSVPFQADERAHLQLGVSSVVRWPGNTARTLLLVEPDTPHTLEPEFARAWHLENIRAGLPQLFAQTHEAFVAQMLNVDLLGGISFEKGCYTGQEIIARTHFRGTVKRRMLRYRADCIAPVPGTRILSAGSHAGDVVDAEQVHGGCELLAVVSLAQQGSALELDGRPGIVLESLPLPYPLG